MRTFDDIIPVSRILIRVPGIKSAEPVLAIAMAISRVSFLTAHLVISERASFDDPGPRFVDDYVFACGSRCCHRRRTCDWRFPIQGLEIAVVGAGENSVLDRYRILGGAVSWILGSPASPVKHTQQSETQNQRTHNHSRD